MKLLFFSRRSLVRPSCLATAFLVFASCNENAPITVYRIPKETTPQPVARTSAAGGEVHWSAPAGWEEQPATGFRKGSFIVRGADGKEADISVVSFPETAGGLLANVNRWRDQLKLAPIAEVQQAGTPLTIGGHQIFFVDLASEQSVLEGGDKARILGGILALNGETWFFKMSGEEQLVASEGDAFRQFLESVHVADTVPVMAGNAGNTNAPTPPPLEAAEAPAVQYKLPPGWQEQPLSSMRLASFKVAGPNEKEADVSVVALPGMAGGDLANVNRWRGQLKLGPIDENALQQSAEHITANGHDYLVVDLASEEPIGESKEKARILAAILDENDRSWFIKMTGEDQTVAAQKNAFASFLRSLTIP